MRWVLGVVAYVAFMVTMGEYECRRALREVRGAQLRSKDSRVPADVQFDRDDLVSGDS